MTENDVRKLTGRKAEPNWDDDYDAAYEANREREIHEIAEEHNCSEAEAERWIQTCENLSDGSNER